MALNASPRTDLVDVAIASSASLSGVISLYGRTLVGIIMPAAWTAAVVTFQAGIMDSTGNIVWYDVYKADGTEYSVTVATAAARFIQLPPSAFAGVDRVKVRSGTTASPVNQGSARAIQLVTRDIG